MLVNISRGKGTVSWMLIEIRDVADDSEEPTFGSCNNGVFGCPFSLTSATSLVMTKCIELKRSRRSLDVLQSFHCYNRNSLCKLHITTLCNKWD